jgi:Spy/CpxP family protein refolding chaperone
MRKGFFVAGLLALAVLGMTGCGTDNNRVPTKDEVKQADIKRQSYIDTIPNLTPEQRAQMKAHMGGPPAPMAGGPGGPKPTGGPANRA